MPPKQLERLAEVFQTLEIIPHCESCERPCCRLETLVLELDWKRLRTLWRVQEQRNSFDAALAEGRGPPEIRSQGGLYYAYQKVCPGYDEVGRTCRVYGSPLKPSGCSDFPIYEQQGHLVADLRCEAVDLGKLEVFLREKLGDSAVQRVDRDEEFPFLVSVAILQSPGSVRRPGRRERPSSVIRSRR